MRWYSVCIITLCGKVFFKYTGKGYLYGVIVYCTCSADCSGVFVAGRGTGGGGVIEPITPGSSLHLTPGNYPPIPGSKDTLTITPHGSLKLNPSTSNPAWEFSFPRLHFPMVSVVELSWSFLHFALIVFPWFELFLPKGAEDPTPLSLLLLVSVALGYTMFERRTLYLQMT